MKVPVYGDGIENVLGFQYTLNVDPENGTIVGLNMTNNGLTADNFGQRFMQKGMITSSWNRPDGFTLEAGSPLYELTIEAKNDMLISELLSLNSVITPVQAYDSEGRILDIELRKREATVVTERLVLSQNNPNPWSEETIISFTLPADMTAQLIVYDLSGKLLVDHKADYKAGKQEYRLDKTMFSSAGVYFYELITENDHLIKKMVLMK